MVDIITGRAPPPARAESAVSVLCLCCVCAVSVSLLCLCCAPLGAPCFLDALLGAYNPIYFQRISKSFPNHFTVFFRYGMQGRNRRYPPGGGTRFYRDPVSTTCKHDGTGEGVVYTLWTPGRGRGQGAYLHPLCTAVSIAFLFLVWDACDLCHL